MAGKPAQTRNGSGPGWLIVGCGGRHHWKARAPSHAVDTARWHHVGPRSVRSSNDPPRNEDDQDSDGVRSSRLRPICGSSCGTPTAGVRTPGSAHYISCPLTPNLAHRMSCDLGGQSRLARIRGPWLGGRLTLKPFASLNLVRIGPVCAPYDDGITRAPRPRRARFTGVTEGHRPTVMAQTPNAPD